MAKNELKIGTTLSMMTIIVSSVIQILYTPLYIKYLGPGDYGINSLVQSIIGYISILNLGLGNTMLRYTTKYRAEGKIEEEKSLNGMFLMIFSILMAIAFIIGVYIYFNIEKFFKVSFTIEELKKTKAVFTILVLNVIISFPMGIFSTNLTSAGVAGFAPALVLTFNSALSFFGLLISDKFPFPFTYSNLKLYCIPAFKSVTW